MWDLVKVEFSVRWRAVKQKVAGVVTLGFVFIN